MGVVAYREWLPYFSMAASSLLFKLSLQAQENEEVRLELEALVSLFVTMLIPLSDAASFKNS